MPKVTIVNSKLTIQMPKYSVPLPVKCNRSTRCEEFCGGGRVFLSLSLEPIPFEIYRCRNRLPQGVRARAHAVSASGGVDKSLVKRANRTKALEPQYRIV